MGQAPVVALVQVGNPVDPMVHPIVQFRVATGIIQKIPPDMGPAKGQDNSRVLSGQPFVGTVTVTDDNYVTQCGQLLVIPDGNIATAVIGGDKKGHRLAAEQP